MPETLLQKLKEYDKTMLPMHMPGHKRNLALSGKDGYLSTLCADCDITEIAGFDNLAEPEGILLSLKKRMAKLWKCEEAYPLVNGSTCGILAGIYATVPYGGSVIAARNCHKSVYNGLRLVNAKVSYMMPDWDEESGYCGSISVAAVKSAIKKEPDAKLIIVTSPTYEGILSDIEGICRIAHEYDIPVLVDSAHGAHLGFGAFPKSAVECGADIVVQSLHKTLPCLTQTAVLFRNGRLVSGERIQSAVNLFQTSSPSYVLLASIEGCVSLLEEGGESLWKAWSEGLSEFYEGARLLKNIRVEDNRTMGGAGMIFGRDPSKLVIVTRGTDLTGAVLMEKLRSEYGIELEMAAERYGLAMTGMGDTKDSLARLLQALFAIDVRCGTKEVGKLRYPELPQRGMSAADAESVAATEYTREEAIGHFAAEYVWAYPPGIPLLVPGEKISEELIAFLLQKEETGVRIHRTGGGNEGIIRCIE